MTYNDLRSANRARQVEWAGDRDIRLTYAGNELAGEVGELTEKACEIATLDFAAEADKLESLMQELREEIGDVAICCDLVALHADLALTLPLRAIPIKPKLPSLAFDLMVETGAACNNIKKLEREQLGMVGSLTGPTALQKNLQNIVTCLNSMCFEMGWDLGSIISEKFNKTSLRYGLQTKLEY